MCFECFDQFVNLNSTVMTISMKLIGCVMNKPPPSPKLLSPDRPSCYNIITAPRGHLARALTGPEAVRLIPPDKVLGACQSLNKG